MATKRGLSPQLVGNPFIKKRNLEWTLDVSYPPHGSDGSSKEPHGNGPELADKGRDASAIEAGKVKIDDHLDYFSELLTKITLLPFPPDTPRLSIGDYRLLYERNSNSPRGAHFIVHQHDHPIAGTHYDLRLQINETSSASWAIMYGLPGDPNNQRLNRNATETRIHCLWVRAYLYMFYHPDNLRKADPRTESSHRDGLNINWLASYLGYGNVHRSSITSE